MDLANLAVSGVSAFFADSCITFLPPQHGSNGQTRTDDKLRMKEVH